MKAVTSDTVRPVRFMGDKELVTFFLSSTKDLRSARSILGQGRGGFIKQDYLRVHRERARNAEPLLLPPERNVPLRWRLFLTSSQRPRSLKTARQYRHFRFRDLDAVQCVARHDIFIDAHCRERFGFWNTMPIFRLSMIGCMA